MRTWFVTGCSSGFGRAIAEEALHRGDRVVATARDPKSLGDWTQRLAGRVISPALDVTDQASMDQAVEDGPEKVRMRRARDLAQ